MTARHTQRVQVLVAGQALEAASIRHQPALYQQQLADARARFGHALCACRAPGLKLVIRERETRLFLAAWPNQAHDHALDCPFYSEVTTGAAAYSPGAIDAAGELTRLTLSHPLRQTGGGASPRSEPRDHAAEGRKASLHLWGLLHFLWEQAGLNRWYPGWNRDWGLVRYLLRRAAQSAEIEGAPLLASLYIPPVWIPGKKDEIEQRWRQFCAPLLKHPRGTDPVSTAFVLGKLRSLEAAEFGHSLTLHHHSPRFYLDRSVGESMARYSRRGWAAAKHLDVAVDQDEKPHVIVAMRIAATKSGRFSVVEGVLMRVSPRFIPVNSSYEDRVARILVDQDREFVRPLHYDNHALDLPDFVLRDVGEGGLGAAASPVAMYVYGPAIPDLQRRRMREKDRNEAADLGFDYWAWDAGDTSAVPPLPTAAPRQRTRATRFPESSMEKA